MIVSVIFFVVVGISALCYHYTLQRRVRFIVIVVF